MYSDCELAVAQGALSIKCSNGSDVSFDRLTPELLLQVILYSLTLLSSFFQWGRAVASGGFGTVYESVLKGEMVAIKTRNISQFATSSELVNDFREFRREAWLCSSISHKTIVGFRGFTLSLPSLILEYIPNGTLYDYLHTRNIDAISTQMRLTILHNIADAMRYLHSHTPKICHRDLKSKNCLMVSLDLDSPTKVPNQISIVCKITDFGESRLVTLSAAGRDNLGNPLWLAPELMRNEVYTEKADVFSFGIVAWEVLAHSEPYSEYPISRGNFMAKFEDEIVAGLRPTIPPHTPPLLKKLIEQCWDGDPNQRPSFADVSLPLFVSFRKSLL